MKITKKTAKIVNIVLIALALVTVLNTVALAAAPGGGLDVSITASSSTLSGCLATIGGSMLGIAQTVGMAAAIILLIVLALKYIGAAPNEKATIKSHAVIYVVGAVILFAASGLVGLIKTWSSDVVK